MFRWSLSRVPEATKRHFTYEIGSRQERHFLQTLPEKGCRNGRQHELGLKHQRSAQHQQGSGKEWSGDHTAQGLTREDIHVVISSSEPPPPLLNNGTNPRAPPSQPPGVPGKKASVDICPIVRGRGNARVTQAPAVPHAQLASSRAWAHEGGVRPGHASPQRVTLGPREVAVAVAPHDPLSAVRGSVIPLEFEEAPDDLRVALVARPRLRDRRCGPPRPWGRAEVPGQGGDAGLRQLEGLLGAGAAQKRGLGAVGEEAQLRWRWDHRGRAGGAGWSANGSSGGRGHGKVSYCDRGEAQQGGSPTKKKKEVVSQ